MDLFEIIKLSIKSLFSFKIRSFLTMLGIIVGISSVTLISSIGAGFQNGLLGDATKSLSKIVSVTINQNKFKNMERKREYYFTKEDREKILKIPNVENVFNSFQVSGEVLENGKFLNSIGINNEWLDIYGYKIGMGRNFTSDEFKDGANLMVLDYNSAVNMFGAPNLAIGKKIQVDLFEYGLQNFTIIGVLEEPKNNATKLFSGNFIMGYFTANLFDNETYKSDIKIKVKDQDKMNITVDLVKKYLKNKSNVDDLYNVDLFNDQLSEVTSILDKISLFISLIAGISLVVGGIGVMNIMLVSVTERISEIGLRKAIGAKNRHILLQFLIESMVLTLIGGMLGLFFGFSLSMLIGLVLKITPVLKLNVLITSLVVSLGTGLIFGIYPAKKASKLSPMEALRTE